MPKPSKKSSLSSLLGDKVEENQKRKPLWEGPYSEGRNGGITYSLLSRFLCCRHRFWLRVIEGFKLEESFDYKMEYGNAWHYCEEHLAKNWPLAKILDGLKTYCLNMSKRFPRDSAEVVKMYECCKRQFPIYVEYWSKHEDVKNRKPIGQEEVFKVKYQLPDSRQVVLRGKFDARDLIKKLVYIQENKSKADINIDKIKNDLVFDLQSNIYIICSALLDGKPVGGIRYNVVRRPLSGMKHNIKQRKGLGKAKKGEETLEQFYDRLGSLIKDKSGEFFVRFRMDVLQTDVEKFKKMVLNPVLMQLCNWWDSIKDDPFDPWNTRGSYDVFNRYPNPHHFVFPSGVYNPVLEGRTNEIDALVQTGNERGFVRTENLFNELEV